MARYLLIESGEPFGAPDGRTFYDLAAQLARAEHEVTLFLIQNGVLAARPGEHSFTRFTELNRAGVQVLADEFSLAERGISAGRLSPGVSAAGLDLIVDRLGRGDKTLWH